MPSASELYNPAFYASWSEGSSNSAAEIVPLIVELLRPQSVVDVGCGIGTWLRAFRDAGVVDILGVDGEWVEPDKRYLPSAWFRQVDLAEPLRLGRQFDVALCLEVAEHLPASAADTLVSSLTNLAPAVVFSAAVPGQGGTNHINEQWPDYWARLFDEHHYRPVDCFRERIWENPRVEYWYAQNVLLFLDETRIFEWRRRDGRLRTIAGAPRRLVHPEAFTAAVKRCERLSAEPDVHSASLRNLIGALPHAVARFLERKLGAGRPAR